MDKAGRFERKLFTISSPAEFNVAALEIFHFQYMNTVVYRYFVDNLKVDTGKIRHYTQIPFLPTGFFKTQKLLTSGSGHEKIFLSSGTTGSDPSKHYVADLNLYLESLSKSFKLFYGDIENYYFFALLPSPETHGNSSLAFMADTLIKKTGKPESGFYLGNESELIGSMKSLKQKNRKILLMGVSYALLDLAAKHPCDLSGVTIMETGGMKGRRTEMVREELHERLRNAFNIEHIHSEYGMTELLSQAYSNGEGKFSSPPWMKVLVSDPEDPLYITDGYQTGGINIIDLANIYTCSFISTQDLGKINRDGTFEVTGRFDTGDIRGCNLMVY